VQNLAGERPLLMAEIGLDSRRNGQAVQAEAQRATERLKRPLVR
jgi:hypothetical protein